MRYSVALCTYDGEKYLAEQLQSIIQQTVPPTQIVICDDMSTDSTNTLIQEYANDNLDINWKHIINEKNIGVARNFEKAIHLCDEDIVFLSDQDDVWIANKAEIILNCFKNTHYSIIFSDGYIVDDMLNDLGITMFEAVNFSSKHQKKFPNNYYGMNLLLARLIVSGATMAFKKKIVQLYLPIPNILFFLHDSWIAIIGTCANHTAFINKPLILYRQHSNQATKIKNSNEPLHIEEGFNKVSCLINRLKIRQEQENLIFNFLKNKPELTSSEVLNLLKIRQRLYYKLINKPEKILERLKTFSFMPYKYKLPEFCTLRMFIGNYYHYIFSKN